MPALSRLRYPVGSRHDLHVVVAEALPSLHRAAALHSGGCGPAAEALVADTFARLAREIRAGRRTVTVGRLLLNLRQAAIQRSRPPSRRRRRRDLERRLVAELDQVLDEATSEPARLLADLPPLARHALVLRDDERLPLPDVAAALGLTEEVTDQVLRAVDEAGGRPAGRGLARAVPVEPPSAALLPRVWADLLDQVELAEDDGGRPAATRSYLDSGAPAPGAATASSDGRSKAGIAVLAVIAGLLLAGAARALAGDDAPTCPLYAQEPREAPGLLAERSVPAVRPDACRVQPAAP